MDKSNGYEEHSAFYIAGRGQRVDGVGTSAVRRWARTLPAGAANAVNIGGKLLFTSPTQIFTWNDAITLQKSVSLGAERYKELLAASGLSVIEEFEDEGENHYYHAVRH